jgi:hypothetical protein
MGLHPIDAYLLEGSPGKTETIAAVLAERRPVERAQPFYRALEALGAKTGDEALIALRLVLGGHAVDDDDIRTLRAHVAGARRGDTAARAAYLAAVETP